MICSFVDFFSIFVDKKQVFMVLRNRCNTSGPEVKFTGFTRLPPPVGVEHGEGRGEKGKGVYNLSQPVVNTAATA